MVNELNVPFDFEVINPNSRNILGEFVYRERDGHAFCITNSTYEFHGNLNLPEIGVDDSQVIRLAIRRDRYLFDEFGNAEHNVCGLTIVEPFIYENAEYYIGDSLSLPHQGRIYDTQTLDLIGNLENGIIVFYQFGN